MNVSKVKSVIVSGLCVIAASLCSGCAIGPQRPPMETVDLNWFVTDCRIRDQQIALLQSMRQTPEDRFAARLTNAITPWRAYTQPRTFAHNYDIGLGQTNWMIDQLLLRLHQC